MRGKNFRPAQIHFARPADGVHPDFRHGGERLGLRAIDAVEGVLYPAVDDPLGGEGLSGAERMSIDQRGIKAERAQTVK